MVGSHHAASVFREYRDRSGVRHRQREGVPTTLQYLRSKQMRKRFILKIGHEDDGPRPWKRERHVAGIRPKEHVGALDGEGAGQFVPEGFMLKLDEADVDARRTGEVAVIRGVVNGEGVFAAEFNEARQ